jgi:predicted heme/steroid binding protein
MALVISNYMSELIHYSSAELKQRNGLGSAPAWVAYKGKIYDVSASPLFKNGKHYRHCLGADGRNG